MSPLPQNLWLLNFNVLRVTVMGSGFQVILLHEYKLKCQLKIKIKFPMFIPQDYRTNKLAWEGTYNKT